MQNKKMNNRINKNSLFNPLVIMVMVMLLFSCEESTNLVYYDKDAPAPVQLDLTTISVENQPGKSVLKYTVPLDENLLYVKAVYETAPGMERQVQSSRFVDTLALEGFADAGTYPVKLYCVGKNKKESKPIEITVSPLIPPLIEAFPSLNLIATFGGIEGNFTNKYQVPLKAVLMADTANTGEPVFLQSYTIKNPNAEFSIRGLKAKPAQFYVYLMDRWGNKTETKEFELTPMFEERLDKTIWKEYKLASDFQNTLENNSPNYVFTNMFNDYVAPNGHYNNFIPEHRPLPSYFTIDLGVNVKVSRFNFVPWWAWVYWSYPKTFEVYGSSIPNPGDNLNGEEWRLLGAFESYRPSGATSSSPDDDFAFIWPDGENFDVKPTELQPDPYFPIRVIRFKILSNWSGLNEYSIDELTIWGEIIK